MDKDISISRINTAEDVVHEFLDYISNKHGISRQAIANLVHNRIIDTQEIVIPIEILKERQLGCMEAIVKFLRENKRLSYQQISELTGRSRSTIGVMYHQTKAKLSEHFSDYPTGENSIPLTELRDKSYSALESIVRYLLSKNLRIFEIARMMNRDYRTIYTVYTRGKVKHER